MTKASGSPFGFIQQFNRLPCNMCMCSNYHLANPFAILNSKRLIGKVDKDNSDLSPVIGINGAGGV